MKVLVVGGTRFAGVHLVNALIQDGHDITIANRGITPDNFQNHVKRKRIDRKNPENLLAAFSDESYDIVFDNLAFCSNDVRYLLDAVHTKRYIMTSTAAVYPTYHMGLQEQEFQATKIPLQWCNREDFPYNEVKRQAEAALFQVYPSQPALAVRIPWIFGMDDYTKRLFFYVAHVCQGQPMFVDNADAQLSFIHSAEAGKFLAWCADYPLLGTVNASSSGTISLGEIIRYAEERSGKKALLHADGEPAPLNGVPSMSLDRTIAQNAGYPFQEIHQWIYPLIDAWVDTLCLK